MVKSEEIKEYYDTVYYSKKFEDKINWGKMSPYYHARKGSIGYYNTFLYILGVQSEKDKGKKILDVACGEGDLLIDAYKRGLQCFGIDISNIAIKAAKARVGGTFMCKDVDRGISFPDEHFDFMTCLGSLEHFQKPGFVLQEMFRTLKKGGRLCILVPNRNYFLLKLGYKTDGQPITNFLSLAEYKDLLEKNFAILKVFKENSHLYNLRYSSSYTKHILKLLIRPLVPFLPLYLSQNFIILCCKPYSSKK